MLFTGQPRQRKSLLEEYQAPLSDVLGATVEETLIRSPTRAGNRAEELVEAEHGGFNSLLDIVTGGPIWKGPDTPVVPAEDARQRIKEEGLDLSVPDDGIREGALDILMERKKAERKRQDILNRAAPGFANATARFATSLGASMLDPLNVGAAFIPAIGPAKYSAMLARAGSTAGRAGVRARVGLAEGAVGATAVEPIVFMSSMAEQADYDTMDSLLNVGLGTVLGGGLHVGAGAVADAAARGLPWQQARPTEPLPRAIDEMPTEARNAALRTAVSQAASGRQIDVAPILAMNARGLRSTTAVGRVAEFEPSPLGRALNEAEEPAPEPEPSVVPGLTGKGEVRVHETRKSAESALKRVVKQGRGQGWRVEETPEGGFVLSRPVRAEPVRGRDGTPQIWKTRRQAQKATKNITSLQGRELDIVPFREGENRGFVLLEDATPDEVRAIEQAPELVRWRQPEEIEAPARQDGHDETLRLIQERVKASLQPRNKRLVDFQASRAADQQLRETVDDDAMPEETLNEIMDDVNETATALGFEESVSRELAEFDELAQTAESYGRAVRAAADCSLRRGAA